MLQIKMESNPIRVELLAGIGDRRTDRQTMGIGEKLPPNVDEIIIRRTKHLRGKIRNRTY